MKLKKPQINKESSLTVVLLNKKGMGNFQSVVFKLYQVKRYASRNEFIRLHFQGSFANA